MTISPPERSEFDAYYATYVDKVSRDTDIRIQIETQLDETIALLNGISDEKSLHRYAPDKWSIRESVSHINDTERVFTFRALWFARGLDLPLPSFDQDVAVSGSSADTRGWRAHVDEFRAIRGATIQLFRNMPDEAWTRRGVASGKDISVRALAYITAGHVAHHLGILRERYL
jgi:hypothetical protein